MKKKPDWSIPSRKELQEFVRDKKDIERIKISVIIELIEPMLGTVPKNPNILTDFVTEKIGDFKGHPIKTEDELNQELETAPKEIDRCSTGFHRDTFGLLIYNYMILGNIKKNLFVLICNGHSRVWAYKQTADLFCKVYPRRIRPYREDAVIMEPDGSIERSINIETYKERFNALTKSDILDKKTRFKFDIKLFRNDRGLDLETLVAALKHGEENGLGRWNASGGYGKYKIISLKYSK